MTASPTGDRSVARRTVLRGLLLAPAAGAVLAACSDDSPSTSATAASALAAGTPDVSPEPATGALAEARACLPEHRRIIDAAAAAVGDSIRLQGIQFSLADPTSTRDAARKAAVADALASAQLVATAAGVHLGAIRSVRLIDIGSVPLQTNLVLAEARAASVPVSAGTEQISASVEVAFDLA